jgi:hypothetical protein
MPQPSDNAQDDEFNDSHTVRWYRHGFHDIEAGQMTGVQPNDEA